MTLSTCDQVAERIALGEPLGELSGHAETCEQCRDLVAVSSKLGATRHAVDPGLGFTARMTVGAQHRIAARRRQRLAAVLAATVASGAIGVFFVSHTNEPPPPVAIELREPKDPGPDKAKDQVKPEDEDLAALVEFADVDRASRVSARWRHIERPLAPYKKLLKGEAP